MQTSEQISGNAALENRPDSRKVPGRTVILLLLFFLLLGGTNALFTFCLEPAQSSSAAMWAGFSRLEQLDLAVVGTSQGLNGIDAGTISRSLSCSAYNMSTNMQSFAASREALSAASDRFGIREAVLVIDHEMFYTSRQDNAKAESSFVRGKVLSEDFPSGVRDSARFIFDPDFFGTSASLLYFFPWTYSREAHVPANIRAKLSGTLPEQVRDAYGFEPSDEVVSSSVYFVPSEEASDWDKEFPDSVKDLVLGEDVQEALRSICSLCQEKNIRLTALVIPYPNAFNIYTVDSYEEVSRELGSLFASYGFTFLDCNLPGCGFTPDPAGFRDVGHMNSRGAEAFSLFLSDLLRKE